jgi:glycerol-1-phosphate dehydrogenase [NAD(P)+]
MTAIERFSPKNFIKPADICGCGFKHDYPLEMVLFGALEECLDLIEDYGVKPPYGILYDEITYEVAGRRVLERLNGKGFVVGMPTYREANLKLEEVRKADVKTIVAVGGGMVIDVARYVAYEGGYEFVAIPTAPSNDGIASPRSALYHESATGELVYTGTSPAKPPRIVIFDVSIISSAPRKLISSGYADVLAKLVSIKDWQLARDDINEPYCKNAEELVMMAVDMLIDVARKGGFISREDIMVLCKALILPGAAMGIVGSTRPAGGSEHMVARHIEIHFKRKIPHGIAVALGTLAMGMLHQLRNPNWWRDEKYSVDAMREYLKIWGVPVRLEEINIPEELMIEAITEEWKQRPERYTILHKIRPDRDLAREVILKSELI